ncbi:MAG: PKD domain-containing protein, partial [Candidatus Aminicenantes bacterium]|nr:PKD domain-containing protein [Candidatus Aminicenantes bacterium]
DIYANHSSDNGANWQGSDTRVDLGTAAGDSGSWGPRICMSGSNVYAVWDDLRNGAEDIYFNLSANGGADWRSFDTRLDSGDPPGEHDSKYSQISCSPTSVYVVWVDFRQPFPEFDIYFNALLEAHPIANELPIAMISGSSTYCLPPKTVSLDGSGSYDSDGSIAVYSWQLTAKPIGSAAALSAGDASAVTFSADLAGRYVVTLQVQDNLGASSTVTSATVTVSAGDPPGLAIQGLRKQERAWIIRKDYVELTLSTTPPASDCVLAISGYRLLRRQGQGPWVTIKEIALEEFTLQSNILILIITDKFLEKNAAYTYRLAALDANGQEAAATEITL